MISLTSPVETRAHRWAAGPKLAGLCVATFVLFSTSSLHVQGLFLVFTALLYAAGGAVFFRVGLSRLWILWPFVLLVLAWHLLTQDAAQGVLIVVRMTTAVALSNLVTMTTRLSDMMSVLTWLLGPLTAMGLRIRWVEIAVALMIRFIPVQMHNGEALMRAWRARSTRSPGWRILLPLAITALDDADHVAEALRARGGV